MARTRPAQTETADVEIQIQAVAWLTEQEKSQSEIAALLNMSQSGVSRLKDKALAKGWLKSEVKCILTPKALAAAQAYIWPGYANLRNRLEDAMKARPENPLQLAKTFVFESGSKTTDPQGYDERLKQFGVRVAAQLSLSDMHKVGVTWGKTIACVVDALETRLPLPPRKSSAIEFVPLSGTLLSDPNIRLSSSSLVDRLHEIVNGQSTGALSLAAVPARLPGKMLPLTHKLRSLKKQFGLNNKSLWELQRAILEVYIHEIHGYQNVFLGGVGKEPLAERVDTILTSVGCDYAQSNDPWLNEMISCETLAKDNDGARRELARIAVGDLGGIFLPTPDARQEDLEKLADINRRWKGASESHIQECAVRAANEGKPGVILIAIGARKAKIVKECVRKGLINQLVIDRDLAEEIATANL